MLVIFFLMVRLPTKTTRTYTLFPYTTLFRSPDDRIARSTKSYNSQIGVALSLWQMNDTHQLAIIEAGVSRTGEMEALHRMIQPYVAVLTTVGPAHDDGFASREAKIQIGRAHV